MGRYPKQFVGLLAEFDIDALLKPNGIVFDVKGRSAQSEHIERL